MVVLQDKKIYSEKSITWQLCQRESPFSWRKNFCCIPNVSWGFLPWEADLLICSKSGYLTEIEIKISATDWENDKKKKKFLYRKDPTYKFTAQAKSWIRIKEFWYAAPIKLAKRHEELNIPRFAGVIGINLKKSSWLERYQILKNPKINRNAEKLTDLEKAHLARLGSIRIWTKKDLL